jgi:hypothetical protein
VGAFVLLIVPALALIGLVVVALAAVAALVALAGTILSGSMSDPYPGIEGAPS